MEIIERMGEHSEKCLDSIKNIYSSIIEEKLLERSI